MTPRSGSPSGLLTPSSRSDDGGDDLLGLDKGQSGGSGSGWGGMLLGAAARKAKGVRTRLTGRDPRSLPLLHCCANFLPRRPSTISSLRCSIVCQANSFSLPLPPPFASLVRTPLFLDSPMPHVLSRSSPLAPTSCILGRPSTFLALPRSGRFLTPPMAALTGTQQPLRGLSSRNNTARPPQMSRSMP